MSDNKALVVLLQGMLADKFAFLLALLTSAGAFGWVLYEPDTIRLAAATLYTLLTYYAVRPQKGPE